MSHLTLVDRIKSSCCKGFAALALAALSGCGAVSMYQQDYPERFTKPPLEYVVDLGKAEGRLSIRVSPSNKYALLVKGKDDGIFVDGDIKNMAKLLLLKGYNIYYTNPVSPVAIERFCDSLAGVADNKTQFFLLLSGHGTKSGFCLKPFKVHDLSWRSELAPQSLFRYLKRVPGKKAVMINSCHSGIFYDELSDSTYWLDDKVHYFNGVLFASCPSNKTSISDPFLGMSTLVYSFCNFFAPEVSEEVDLSRISFSQQSTPGLDIFVFLSKIFTQRISFDTKTFSTVGYKF